MLTCIGSLVAENCDILLWSGIRSRREPCGSVAITLSRTPAGTALAPQEDAAQLVFFMGLPYTNMYSWWVREAARTVDAATLLLCGSTVTPGQNESPE